MSKNVKRYPLSDDYCIECVTLIDDYGNKSYGVAVIFTTLELEIESVRDITSADEANKCYKELLNKYKGI